MIPLYQSDPPKLAASLQRAIENKLSHTEMSFVLRKTGADLQIPGHLPIQWSPMSSVSSTPTPLQFYEETTTLLLSYLIECFDARMFFDVGAGIGYFSRVAASHATVATTVHAFEMRPDRLLDLQCIISNDRFRDRINPHLAGLSSVHKGRVEVWHVRDMLFEHRPEPLEYRETWWRRLKFLMLKDRNRALRRAEVLVTSIDHFCMGAAAYPDIIKIDVEGYEGRVLNGSKETLAKRHPFVLLELHKDKKLRHGARRVDVAGMMFALGYQALFLTDHKSRRTCDVVEIELDSPLLRRQQTDLVLFFHPDYRCTGDVRA